ncbi:MAG TPA: protein-glutamate O-methyltransferase CheR [Nevskiaceae bacterium]|nr:protein-glutamate O-methyltransferase CheR [Nevskiaceae bacterium]
MNPAEIDDLELDLFVEALRRRHGYDFSGYVRASLKRRVQALQAISGARTVSHLTERVLHEPAFVEQVIERLSVPVSEMFRTPSLFRLLREEVVPVLASWPRITIWQAGCAHGEEVYSLAILLSECGLYDRCRIHATDFSEAALARAREGIYPLREARLYSENYLKAGGTGTLSDWYVAAYQHIKLDDRLKANISFSHHNLVADGAFAEMQLILCRNVLIYFERGLQDRVIELFRGSLARRGFLCLGSKESLAFSSLASEFETVAPGHSLYRLRHVR